MKTVIFDIEADNLLHGITKVYVIACVDADGGNRKIFTDEKELGIHRRSGTLTAGVKYLLKADRVVCHNIMGYDWYVLNKFWPELWNLKTAFFTKCWDTLVQSKAQHYDRLRLKGTKSRHGLEYFGLLFKYPKPPIEDWSYWDAEKLNRCLVDIEINRKTYHYLNNEASKIGLDFSQQIRRTTESQFWYTQQELNGWTADKGHLEASVKELDTMIEDLRLEIEPRLPPQLKVKSTKCTWEDVRDCWDKFFRKVPATQYDEIQQAIRPAYRPVSKPILKSGDKYDRHTASHFDISTDCDLEGWPILGAYTKVEFESSKMSQHAVVKDYLLSVGWVPTQWNFKKDSDGKILRDGRGKPIKSSPKLTEDSFESIQGDLGEKIAKYNTLVHRRRTIENEKSSEKGWLNLLRGDGKISAGAMAWATSTSRAAQFGIVNVPSSAAFYGAPMRKAWVSSENHKIVSVDMDSAQLRLLANYMGDEEFTKAVTEGVEFDEDGQYRGTDAHTFNTRFFGLISDDDWREAIETQRKDLIEKISKARKKGKNGIYALLFGAGDEKFAITVGYRTAQQGKAVKDLYFTRLSKLRDLIDHLEKQMKENPWRGGGYIQVAGGCWVWCHSSHKILNYLLMGSEAQLQNEALNWCNRENIKRGLKGKQLAAIHDELNWEFENTFLDKGKGLLSQCYEEASNKFNLEVLVTGVAQAGDNWLDVH